MHSELSHPNSRLGNRPPGCRWAVATFLTAAGVLLACQSTPTGSDGPRDGTQADSVQISDAPSTLLVHDQALLTAAVWRFQQQVFDSPLSWESSDPSIASVRSSGKFSAVLTGQRRGTVTITGSAGGVASYVTLRVTADLRFLPRYILDVPGGWPMAVGDQLQLHPVYADVSGQPLPEIPSLSWSSSDPAGVNVSRVGLVTAIQAGHTGTVTATDAEDTIRVQIRVLDVLALQPATLRIVHGVPGIGSVRFLVGDAAPVSLSFGQSVELPVLSGTLRVTTEGLPRGDPAFGNPDGEFIGLVRPGDHLSLYAAGNPNQAFLQPAWPTSATIPPDSGLVRLVQSSPAMVVYLRAHAAPKEGLPELCYFDPGTMSDYLPRPAGDFDVIGQAKYDQEHDLGRAATSVAGGHAVTMVLTGGGPEPLTVLTFTDR